MLDQDQLRPQVLPVVGRNLSISKPDLVRRTLSTQLDENRTTVFKVLVLHKEALLGHACGKKEEQEKEWGSVTGI